MQLEMEGSWCGTLLEPETCTTLVKDSAIWFIFSAPVKCTRPHEKWDSCPSPCYRENCEDRDIKPKICTYEGLNTCDPRCTCIEGYYRDQLEVCVPSAECGEC